MAKFGRFNAAGTDAFETYEGDFMQNAGNDYVHVLKSGGPNEADRIVAIIHIQQGESVRKIG